MSALTRQAVKAMPADDLLDLVCDMPYRDLLLMPHDVVAQLPDHVRQMRHDRVVVDSAHADALAIVRTCTVDELLTIDREIADPIDPSTPHLPHEFREIRRDRILGERDSSGRELAYNRERTCMLFGVQIRALVKWRRQYLTTGKVSSSAIPQSDVVHTNTRRPFDGKRGPGASPLWYISTLAPWGKKARKLNEYLFPEPQPGGRPAGDRTDVDFDLGIPRQAGERVPA